MMLNTLDPVHTTPAFTPLATAPATAAPRDDATGRPAAPVHYVNWGPADVSAPCDTAAGETGPAGAVFDVMD